MSLRPDPGVSFPSVSVVVLNYNYGRYVDEALDSVTGQEPGDYRLSEVVVIDDGSTDDSHRVYARYPGVRIVLKPHEGFAATLNRAPLEAAGEWLTVLDADDTFSPDKLRTLAPHMVDPATLLIQHGEYVIDEKGEPYAEGLHEGGSTSTLAVRTTAARELQPVTNELFFHVLADLGHALRLSTPLTRYRVHEHSMTDRADPGVFADYMADVCTDVATRLEQLRTRPPAWTGAENLAVLGARYRTKAAEHRHQAGRQRAAGAQAATEGDTPG